MLRTHSLQFGMNPSARRLATGAATSVAAMAATVGFLAGPAVAASGNSPGDQVTLSATVKDSREPNPVEVKRRLEKLQKDIENLETDCHQLNAVADVFDHKAKKLCASIIDAAQDTQALVKNLPGHTEEKKELDKAINTAKSKLFQVNEIEVTIVGSGLGVVFVALVASCITLLAKTEIKSLKAKANSPDTPEKEEH